MDNKIIQDCIGYCEDHNIDYSEFKKIFYKNYDSFYIDVKNNTIEFFRIGDYNV